MGKHSRNDGILIKLIWIRIFKLIYKIMCQLRVSLKQFRYYGAEINVIKTSAFNIKPRPNFDYFY